MATVDGHGTPITINKIDLIQKKMDQIRLKNN